MALTIEFDLWAWIDRGQRVRDAVEHAYFTDSRVNPFHPVDDAWEHETFPRWFDEYVNRQLETMEF